MADEEMYTITCTREQAGEIQRALETVARMASGQFDMAFDYCMDREGNYPIDSYTVDEVKRIVKPKMGLAMNQSWGVGRLKRLDHLWEMMTVIRHRLAWDHAKRMNFDPGQMSGVDFYSPMKYTDKPFISISQAKPSERAWRLILGDFGAGLDTVDVVARWINWACIRIVADGVEQFQIIDSGKLFSSPDEARKSPIYKAAMKKQRRKNKENTNG